MAADRSGRARRARGNAEDYGRGVPIRGMYDYSVDYGRRGGPETDSESIPGYDTNPGNWTGPTPDYERRHWAAREPSYREGSGLRGRNRDERDRYGRYERPSSGRHWYAEASRGELPASREHGLYEQGFAWPSWGGLRRAGSGQAFGEELGGAMPAYGQDPWWWRGSSYDRAYRRDPWNGMRRAEASGYGRDYRAHPGRRAPAERGPERERSERYRGQAGARSLSVGRYDRDYPPRTLQRWEEEWERNRRPSYRGDSDFEAYDREFTRWGGARHPGVSRARRPGPG